jgi:hypothetical protein
MVLNMTDKIVEGFPGHSVAKEKLLVGSLFFVVDFCMHLSTVSLSVVSWKQVSAVLNPRIHRQAMESKVARNIERIAIGTINKHVVIKLPPNTAFTHSLETS